jgi:hypothetical protein
MNDKALDSQLLGFSHGTIDPLRRVEEAGFWLEAYRQSIRADPLRVYQVVDRLDELVQQERLEVTREYLDAGGRQQTYRERRIWNAVVHLARELAAGYETSLQLFQAGEPNSVAVAPLVPSITARAMRAFTLVLRWTLLRYAAVEPGFWTRLGALFAYAERERFMSERFKLYPAMAGESTVRREYLRALVLSVSGTENLLPANQVVAERVIATVAEFFLLHRRPAAGCHFAVDLHAGRAPYRIGDGVAPSRAIRFFGPGHAAVIVQGLIQRATDTGTVPSELNLVGDFPAPLVLEVMHHLARHWGPDPPARSELRQRVLSTLNVAHGFEQVLSAVSAEQGSVEVDELTEAWTVENESSGGLGAVLPPRHPEWLAIGSLVSAKPTWPAAWSVGVIRRLSTDEKGRRAVGVQVLARGGIAVELSPLPLGQAGPPRSGILLPGEAQTSLGGAEVKLVLARASVSWSLAYAMRIQERSYSVNPRRVIESGDDFDVVSFTLQAA